MRALRRTARRIAGPLLVAFLAAAGTGADVLHVRAGAPAGGDGSAVTPFATLAEAAARSAPGDRLVLHAAAGASLAGGIALQPGQTLIGAPAASGAAGGERPRITGGDGPAVALADGCRVIGVEVAGGGGPGLVGSGVRDVRIEDVGVADTGSAAIELSGEVDVELHRVTIGRAAGAGVFGHELSGRLTIADSSVDSAAAGVLVAAVGALELAIEGGRIAGSRSSALSLQADGAAAVTGIIARTSIDGSALGRGIEVLADDRSRMVVALDGNQVSGTEHQGIYADAQDEARLDLTLRGNRLAAPRMGSYGLEVNVREQAGVCLAARDNHSAAPTGGEGLRARQRHGSTLRVEGASSAVVATVEESLEGGNAGTSVVIAAAEGLQAVPEGTCLLP